MSKHVLGVALVLIASCLARSARAEDRAGKVMIGLGVNAVSPIHQVCEKKGDASHCDVFHFYGGGDLSVHYYLTDWFALGVRGAGSKNFNTSRDVSNLGESETDDRWLWRFAAEARVHPPILPLWLAGEIGGAFLAEHWQEYEKENAAGKKLGSASATQKALLLGVASGLDLHLSQALLLGLELRVELMPFGAPPKLNSSVSATNVGSAPWVDLGARLAYLF